MGQPRLSTYPGSGAAGSLADQHAIVWGSFRHFAWEVGLSLLCIERTSMYLQLYEVKRDALMMRTRNRPLPQGRVTPRHALAFALATGIGGVSILYWKVQ